MMRVCHKFMTHPHIFMFVYSGKYLQKKWINLSINPLFCDSVGVRTQDPQLRRLLL